MANSSPLRRATVSPSRTHPRSRCATTCSSRSPAGWPRVSLTSLKWSRSRHRTASQPPWRLQAPHLVLQPLAEQDAVRQAAERVVVRHVGDLSLGEPALGDVLVGGDPAAAGHRPVRDGDREPSAAPLADEGPRQAVAYQCLLLLVDCRSPARPRRGRPRPVARRMSLMGVRGAAKPGGRAKSST